MAKVSAHGKTIGTIYRISSADRYMSDGYVLRNLGFGWKIQGKVKTEYTPESAYKAAADRYELKLQQFPALAEYRKQLHSLTSMTNRWKLHSCVDMMSDDPDGVWSNVVDGYGCKIDLTLDEIVEICKAYREATAEAQKIKAIQ